MGYLPTAAITVAILSLGLQGVGQTTAAVVALILVATMIVESRRRR